MTEPLRHDIGGVPFDGSDLETVPDAPDAVPVYASPAGDEEVVERAAEAARRGFRVWRSSVISDRIAVLLGAAEVLDGQAAALAPLVTRETGKPLLKAEDEARSAAQVLRNYASHVAEIPSRVMAEYSARVWGMEISEPVGVAALITPWNLPLQLAAVKLGAAVAAGCSFVAKPSPFAAASIHALIGALRAGGLPAEAASVVHGGRDTALMLAQAPGIDLVSLTGSSSAGRDVMRAAANGTRRCTLELGGKSANVVFDDADLDIAVPGIVAGFIRNQGAVCTAGSRILVQESVFADLMDRLVPALMAVTVGDPNHDVDLGAIRTLAHRDFIRQEIDCALSEGATLAVGGEDVSVPGRGGAYLRPALLLGVKPSHRIWNTELFGPVATITSFATDEEAIALADNSDYGLAAGVWSRDLARIERMWRDLSVGTVYVNSYHRIDGIPLAASGRRASGFGSEGGAAGIAGFLATKSIHFRTAT